MASRQDPEDFANDILEEVMVLLSPRALTTVHFHSHLTDLLLLAFEVLIDEDCSSAAWIG